MHSLLDKKRLVAFDLDGTLIDSVPDLAAALARAFNEEGLTPPSVEAVSGWVGNGAQVLVERALGWAFDVPEATLDEALSTRVYAAFLRHYGDAPHRLTQLYPGVADTLKALDQAGFVLILITNKPERFIAPLLSHFAIDACFSLRLGGDSLARKKPDPLPLVHAAAHFGVPANACVMVGDSRHDIAAGKAAGFATVALTYGYNHGEPISQSAPDALLDSLTELLSTSATPTVSSTRTAR
ncbi:phosphoglycolate phosphatase [Vreelandella subglaciescola]|uniref:Phosphoglycolate phosphatase n=1 Tax=Vreelandella subglaciescola TaxID=29571 RepID=A0A1M7ILJ8_9GAMM|nr:phosphoglycolate phosphatase [Halomonas subglaciescola]SHM41571.1 phosphoglycolate phosphatase [Halomonas subglaciescola]